MAHKLYYDKETRRRYWTITISCFISVVVLFPVLVLAGIAPKSIHSKETDAQPQQRAYESEGVPEATSSPSVVSADDDESASPHFDKLYSVVHVADGDTITVEYDGTIEYVRLIGVNTPETVDPRKAPECFGAEASDYLKSLLNDKKVGLEADDSQDDRDSFGRLLRYVYLDGSDVGLAIIGNGFGYEYTYNIPYKKQALYRTAQDDAATEARGLWAPNTCGGLRESSQNIASI